jgi:hypothetical protein
MATFQSSKESFTTSAKPGTPQSTHLILRNDYAAIFENEFRQFRRGVFSLLLTES